MKKLKNTFFCVLIGIILIIIGTIMLFVNESDSVNATQILKEVKKQAIFVDSNNILPDNNDKLVITNGDINVYENAVLLNTICGKSDMDLTSVRTDEDFTRLIGKEINGMKIAIPKFYVSDAVDKEIREKLDKVIDILKSHDCEIDYVDIKYIDQAVYLYQIIAMGEASSNLARFDGIRYGYRYEDCKDINDMYVKTRRYGFGNEVKRRIMIGSYLLSGDNATTYYNKALSIRDDMRNSFLETFKKYDLIIGPTATTKAYPLGVDLDDAVKAFMDDILTIPVNMAGLPGMNLPIGFSFDHLPIGMQIIGAPFDEAKMYQLASFLEKELNLDLNPGGDYNE